MRNLLLIEAIIVIGICLSNCKSSTQNSVEKTYPDIEIISKGEDLDSVKLEEKGKLSFTLDSLSAPSSPSVSFFSTRKEEYLSLLNTVNSSIDVYDIKTRKLSKRVNLFKEGPNGIGNTAQISHSLISLDSVLVLNPSTSSFFIVDGSGKVIYKASNVLDYQDDRSVEEHPRGSTAEPLVYFNNKIYSSGVLLGLTLDNHQKMKCMIIHDTKSKETKNVFPRPTSYNKGNWGGNCMMDFCYYTFNKRSNKFVYSFPVDDVVYETDHNSPTKAYYAKSVNFDEVLPMYDDKLQKPDHKKSIIYDYTTSHYYKIVHDPYRKVYYRFTLLGNTNDEIDNPEIGYNQQESVIIMNENFRKIGENIIPRGNYVYHNFFVNKDGLYMLMQPSLLDDENKMVYIKFNLIANNN